MRLRCRLLGCAWCFAADGEDVVWHCRRGCLTGGRASSSSAAEARRIAVALERRRPAPALGFLAALAGAVPPVDAQSGVSRTKDG